MVKTVLASLPSLDAPTTVMGLSVKGVAWLDEITVGRLAA